MAINTNQETVFTLTEATKRLPSMNGKRIAISTLWRWCSKGLDGVHLEHVRIGRRIYTSSEALDRFANALAAAGIERLNPPLAIHRPRRQDRLEATSPRLRLRQIAEAKEILEQAGF